MEQEYGEQSSATSLAARTVLPGEPFDPPAAEAVPGPREVNPETAPAPMQEAPVWSFGPPSEGDVAASPPVRSFDPATYDPTYGDPNTADPHHAPVSFTPTYATAESLSAAEVDSLHQYGELPGAEDFQAVQYAAPDVQTPPAYPAGHDVTPAFEPTAFEPSAFEPNPLPAYPSGDVPPPPAYAAPVGESWGPPVVMHEAFAGGADQATLAPPLPPVDEPPTGDDAEGGHRTSNRRPSTALIALAAVVVLGGGGYFGYTQLSKSDNNTNTTNSAAPVTPAKSTAPSSSVAPVVPVAGAYNFPSHLAGFPLRTSQSAIDLKTQITSFSSRQYPTFMGTPSVTSYGAAAHASVVAVSFHPAAASLNAAFTTILSGVKKPATGNSVGVFKAVPAGAAGGSMTCGVQTGASPMAYCVWKGKSTVGEVYMAGQTQASYDQALTRELRAYGEK